MLAKIFGLGHWALKAKVVFVISLPKSMIQQKSSGLIEGWRIKKKDNKRQFCLLGLLHFLLFCVAYQIIAETRPHLYNDIPVNYLWCLHCNCVELVSRSIWVKRPPVSLQSWYHCSHCISQTFDRRFLETNFGCNQCFYKKQVCGKFPGIFW